MLMNREAGNENRQIKIDPGEAGEAEGDAEQFELVHGGKYADAADEVTRFRRGLI